jgi:site-specific DNA-cytosine methylase
MKAFVDLFCGAGGAGLGLKRAGLQPLLGVDKYSRAVEVYREAVGPAIQADVRDLNPLQVVAERPFLLWASPPCPPWSQGRKWRGLPMGFDTEDGLLLLEPIRFQVRVGEVIPFYEIPHPDIPAPVWRQGPGSRGGKSRDRSNPGGAK